MPYFSNSLVFGDSTDANQDDDAAVMVLRSSGILFVSICFNCSLLSNTWYIFSYRVYLVTLRCDF